MAPSTAGSLGQIRVGVAQFASTSDASWNLTKIEELARSAAERGADLAAFPENANVFPELPKDSSRLLELAEPIGGSFTRSMDKLAASLSMTIVAGMLEVDPHGGRPFNTLYATDGGQLATYRKTHLYDAFGFRESDFLQESDQSEPSTFLHRGIRIGLMTCYDLRFPESARELIDAGAEVIIVPTAWEPGPRKEDHWNVLVRARAIENTCFVVAPNQTRPNGTAFSLVVDPMGVQLAELDDECGVAVVDLHLERLSVVRSNNPALLNRRFETRRTIRTGHDS